MRRYELHATTEPTSWPISVGPRVVWRLCWSLAQSCSKFNFLWEIFSKPIFFAGKMSRYRSIMSISPRKMRCDRTQKNSWVDMVPSWVSLNTTLSLLRASQDCRARHLQRICGGSHEGKAGMEMLKGEHREHCNFWFGKITVEYKQKD